MKFNLGSAATIVGFYDKSDNEGWMANTALGYPIVIDEKEYPSVEHYFHCMKFTGEDGFSKEFRRRVMEKTENMSDFPQFVKKLTQELLDKKELGKPRGLAESFKNGTFKKEWDKRSTEIMRKGVRAKLDRYPSLHTRLVGLKEEGRHLYIVEALKRAGDKADKKWADGGDGTGENGLGCILTAEAEIRANGLDEAEAIKIAGERNDKLKQYRQQRGDFKGKSLYDIAKILAKTSSKKAEVKADATDKTFIDDENIKKLETFLSKKSYTMGKPGSDGSFSVKDAAGEEAFKIYNFKLTTASENEKVLKLMLEVFKETYGDKLLPNIKCDESLVAVWEKMGKEVYGDKKLNIVSNKVEAKTEEEKAPEKEKKVSEDSTEAKVDEDSSAPIVTTPSRKM